MIPTVSSRRSRSLRTRQHRLECLEPRCVLSTGAFDIDAWRSAIFDDQISGSLEVNVLRSIATVDPTGQSVASNEPRFAEPRLVTDTDLWQSFSGFSNLDIAGSGWDHDGATPVAVSINNAITQVRFYRGDDFTVVGQISMPTQDLLNEAVAGFRYKPRQAIVHEGLIVFMTERQRQDGGQWVPEGVTFIYTQDYGQTLERVAQVGGGFDVPPLAGGVADGLSRGEKWAFTNAFGEQGREDLLGAWFPWADYLWRTGSPKGGQIGLFRARRSAVGELWVVEPNVTVFERWEIEDAGGMHAHSAGMLTDGLASFWGDVDYRNHVARHVASDLENYTTAIWTHDVEFQGAWSPDAAKVYDIGNQGASTAPGPLPGQILLAGDEQSELVMLIEAPETPGEKVRVTNLYGNVPGTVAGSRFTGRTSIWLHYLRGRGYVIREFNSRVSNENAFHYSPDGIHWSIVQTLPSDPVYLYGDKFLTQYGDELRVASQPETTEVVRPLVINPGGTNLVSSTWEQTSSPGDGNEIRPVDYLEGIFVYADTGEPLDIQPEGVPPVAAGARYWEIISDGTNSDVGAYRISEIPSELGNRHFLAAWHYALDGDGIDPGFSVSSGINSVKTTRWVTNTQWVPTYNYGTPNQNGGLALPNIEIDTGFTAPRRWLMVVDGFIEGVQPTYPLSPGVTGSNEIVDVRNFRASEEWSIGLTFGLPQSASFSSYIDSAGIGVYHPIATLGADNGRVIAVGFTRTTGDVGQLSVDVVTQGVLSDRVSFANLRIDRGDRVSLLLSGTPDSLGATVLTHRHQTVVRSRVIVDTDPIRPSSILLSSDAARTTVSALEWYAVQVHTQQSMTAAEREAFILSDQMFVQQDVGVVVQLSADFNGDNTVNGDDFLIWQLYVGTSSGATKAMGDANGDGAVNGQDFLCWQAAFGQSVGSSAAATDFNLAGATGGDDFLPWQTSVGRSGGILAAAGAAEHDPHVGGDDFLLRQAALPEQGPVATVSQRAGSVARPESKQASPVVVARRDLHRPRVLKGRFVDGVFERFAGETDRQAWRGSLRRKDVSWLQ